MEERPKPALDAWLIRENIANHFRPFLISESLVINQGDANKNKQATSLINGQVVNSIDSALRTNNVLKYKYNQTIEVAVNAENL